MIWCFLRWGQAILRFFEGHPIPVPRMLLRASGDVLGVTPLAYNPRSEAGVSHPSHNHRETTKASAVSLFWQERQPLPLAPYPDSTRPPASPRPWTLAVSPTAPPCQAGDAMGGSALCQHLPRGLRSTAPCSPPAEPHLCLCGPAQANPLPPPRLGTGRTCSVPGSWAVPSSITVLSALLVGVARVVPAEVAETMESSSARGPRAPETSSGGTLPMGSWTTAPLTCPPAPWQVLGRPFPRHPSGQGMLVRTAGWERLPRSWDLAGVQSHAR